MSISATNKTLSEIDTVTLPQKVFFGNVMYDAGGTFGPRLQEHVQLVIIRSGEATLCIDGREHSLREGEVALLHKGRREYFEFSKRAKTYHS